MLDLIFNEKDRKLQASEYKGADGLIYCSVCHKAKQSTVGDFLHKSLCDCEKKERDKEAEMQRQAERRMIITKRTKACFGDNNMLPKYTFENSKYNTTAARLCFNYCENWQDVKANSRSIILCGGVGVGKTYLACCICNKLIADYYAIVHFITEYDFLNGYMASDNKAEYINDVCNCDLLVIDDIGIKWYKQNGVASGYLNYINDLIDKRYNNGKPVVVTTNLNKELFLKERETTDEQRVFSRLAAMAGNPVYIKGSDNIRQSQADAKTEYIRGLV